MHSCCTVDPKDQQLLLAHCIDCSMCKTSTFTIRNTLCRIVAMHFAAGKRQRHHWLQIKLAAHGQYSYPFPSTQVQKTVPSEGCSKPQSTIARSNSGFRRNSRKPALWIPTYPLPEKCIHNYCLAPTEVGSRMGKRIGEAQGQGPQPAVQLGDSKVGKTHRVTHDEILSHFFWASTVPFAAPASGAISSSSS